MTAIILSRMAKTEAFLSNTTPHGPFPRSKADVTFDQGWGCLSRRHDNRTLGPSLPGHSALPPPISVNASDPYRSPKLP